MDGGEADPDEVKQLIRVPGPPFLDRLDDGAAQEVISGLDFDDHDLPVVSRLQRALEPLLINGLAQGHQAFLVECLRQGHGSYL